MNSHHTSFVESEFQKTENKQDSEKKIIIVMGPAGAGKGTNIGELAKHHSEERVLDKETLHLIENPETEVDKARLLFLPKIHFALSMTTRAMRTGEVNGKTYYFVDKDEFAERKANSEFIETTSRAGQDYGTLKSEFHKPLVLREMDIKGLEVFLQSEFKNRIQVIAVVPEDIKQLKKRIINRSSITVNELKERLKLAEIEMEYIEQHKSKMNVVVTYEGEQEEAYMNFRNAVFGITQM